MEKHSPLVEDYIAQAPEFARPILTHLRQLLYQASPLIQETFKWKRPFYEYKGPLCNMAAFKQHCSFGFWKESLLTDPHQVIQAEQGTAGSFGRLTTLADLPADEVIIAYIREAIALNEAEVKPVAKSKPATDKKLVVPEYFLAYLKQHPQAETQFNQYSYSHQKEYVEWITEAKKEETRQKRMQTAIEWLTTGKSRHWKHQS